MNPTSTRRSPVIRLPRCIEITGLSRSTILSYTSPKSAHYDQTFPKKVRIGLRAVGWYEDEIYAWVASKRA